MYYRRKKNLVLALILLPALLWAQDSTGQGGDTVDSTKINLLYLPVSLLHDSTAHFNLELSPDSSHRIYIPRITLPENPLEIDRRGSSYYTPRVVRDELDRAMNRPRAESFVPVLALVPLAIRLAEKHLAIEKLLRKNARDYLIPERSWRLLKILWQKAPLNVAELYAMRQSYSAGALEKELQALSEKGLLKTRKTGNGIVLFFPAEKPRQVLKYFTDAISLEKNNTQTLKILLQRKKELEELTTP
ncbi:MAG TPA: hypothetical protein ENJ15_02385 [Caldithrix abyssi]|uniref:ArsR family transcriptional regulator n=1 Tax=Caldithrix abyssi TaxID=187145 RepID=A0A7V5RP05_CALAY|nr:hypothetical protein [Caldithrix abyssi]